MNGPPTKSYTVGAREPNRCPWRASVSSSLEVRLVRRVGASSSGVSKDALSGTRARGAVVDRLRPLIDLREQVASFRRSR